MTQLLELHCHVCGKTVSDGTFVLLSLREKTDRPFVVCAQCVIQVSDNPYVLLVEGA